MQISDRRGRLPNPRMQHNAKKCAEDYLLCFLKFYHLPLRPFIADLGCQCFAFCGRFAGGPACRGSCGVKDQLLKLISAFLQKYRDEETGLTDASAQLLDQMVTVLRGLLVVLNPVPGKHSAGLKDFEFVWPPNATKKKERSFMKCCLKYANRLTNQMSRAALWVELVGKYKSFVGTEEGCRDDIEEFTTLLCTVCSEVEEAEEGSDNVKKADANEKLIVLMSRYRREFGRWNSNCRAGWSQDIEALLRPQVEFLVSRAMQEPSSSETVDMLQHLKELAETLGMTATVDSLASFMFSAVESSVALRLTSLVNSGINSMQNVTELLGIWRASRNKDSEGLLGHSRQLFVDARPLVMRFMAEEVCDPSSTDESCTPIFELARLFHTETQLRNLDSHVADTENKSLICLMSWAKHCLHFKCAIPPSDSPLTDDAASRRLLVYHTTIKSWRSSKKNVGFDPHIQGCMDVLTEYVATIEPAAAAAIVAGGIKAFQATGTALIKVWEEAKKFAGCSPTADGEIWHTLQGGCPAAQADDAFCKQEGLME